MALIEDVNISEDSIIAVAKKMMLAARTAPKGRGIDNLKIALAVGEEVNIISAKMKEIGEKISNPTFLRDAGNVLQAKAIVIIGTRIKSIGLAKCGMCGFANCAEKDKHPTIPCVFNTGDLGIAMGSAVSMAADFRIDNRIMYTIGQAVVELQWLGADVPVIYGIPLAASSKNPFFDRK